MTLIDFTLSNARRFYSSVGNPLDMKGLSNLDHGDKKVTNSHILRITENNDFEYFTGECVCVRACFFVVVHFLYISQSYPGYEIIRFSVDFVA